MYVSVSLHTSITIEKCVSAKHQHCRHTPEYTLLIFPCHWILNGFNVGICEKEGGGESEQLQFMGNFYVFSCHSVAYYWNRNKIALKLIVMFGYCELHSSPSLLPRWTLNIQNICEKSYFISISFSTIFHSHSYPCYASAFHPAHQFLLLRRNQWHEQNDHIE